MPLLQFIWSTVILVAFLMVVFWVAWYVAVPLLLFWLILLCIRQGRLWFDLYRSKTEANGCTIRRTSSDKSSSSEVIDVDYTEI